MAKVHVFSLPNGRAAVIHVAPNPAGSNLSDAEWELFVLAKTRFERTRPATPEGHSEHFNPGNPAHMGRTNSIALTELDDADLPSKADRNNWMLQGEGVVVSPTPL